MNSIICPTCLAEYEPSEDPAHCAAVANAEAVQFQFHESLRIQSEKHRTEINQLNALAEQYEDRANGDIASLQAKLREAQRLHAEQRSKIDELGASIKQMMEIGIAQKAKIDLLSRALTAIAYDVLGPSDASFETALSIAESIAREALKSVNPPKAVWDAFEEWLKKQESPK